MEGGVTSSVVLITSGKSKFTCKERRDGEEYRRPCLSGEYCGLRNPGNETVKNTPNGDSVVPKRLSAYAMRRCVVRKLCCANGQHHAK